MVNFPDKPELLAPAGNWECAKAAVENGADAIYFGVGRFNARVRANNFSVNDLPKLMKFLHRRGVRGYVTFNTLIFSNELDTAAGELRKIIAAGVDAAIVQDVGIVRLIRKISPDFPVHASTQMTISSAAGIRFARELGASLAVLSREVNIAELEKIVAQENADPAHALPLEMFVHGALCVSYSGQCLTSEALGGRSANRGECAQACRLPYELICDGEKVPLGSRRYLLSPQDLASIEILPELISLGVRSFKIEGRLKSPEYVAAVTRVYRDCVDRLYAMAQDDVPAETLSEFAKQLREKHAYELEMAFSRGLFTGWFRGIDNKNLVHARFGKKRGVFLGEISGFGKDGIFTKLRAPLKSGDGVVFASGNPEEKELGGYVYGVSPSPRGNGETFVRFAHDGIRWEKIRRGDKIWKTSDTALTAKIRGTFSGEKPLWTRKISMQVFAETGKPLRAQCSDFHGNAVSAEIGDALPPATERPATDAWLREQFSRLGGTAYHLGEWQSHIADSPLVPASIANKLRRALVEKLDSARENSVRWQLSPEAETADFLIGEKSTDPLENTPPTLVAVVRELAQLDASLASGVKTIYAEFENPRDYREAATRVHAVPNAEFWAQPPRIFKEATDEANILRTVRECGADGFLVRAHEHLYAFPQARLRGDFSLNIANHLSAEYFLKTHALESVTASYDLNSEQLFALLERVLAPGKIEITLHQHMPMFHMEHCVFCAFIANKKDFRECGRPCEKHTVRLRDRTGAEHLVKADASCRNTVYNARAQTGAEFFNEIFAHGVRRFRVEFVDEPPALVTEILKCYDALFHRKIDGNTLWRRLRLESKLGVTRGTLKEKERVS